MDAGKMPNLQKFVERTARKLFFVQGGRFAALLGIGGASAIFLPGVDWIAVGTILAVFYNLPIVEKVCQSRRAVTNQMQGNGKN